jgi:hypothetical protein
MLNTNTYIRRDDMEKVTEKLSNGNTIEYEREGTEGTCYHASTPIPVRFALESARNNKSRVRVFYGDKISGKDWLEENDVTGYIGRSTGTIKIPLLIHNSRSLGGPALLDDCIVRLLVGKREVYRHANYNTPAFEITDSDLPDYAVNVLVDTVTTARFKTKNQAERWIAFMKGERLNK